MHVLWLRERNLGLITPDKLFESLSIFHYASASERSAVAAQRLSGRCDGRSVSAARCTVHACGACVLCVLLACAGMLRMCARAPRPARGRPSMS